MAQTLSDSLLLHVSKHAVFDEIERDAAFARKMLAGLSRRLHSLISDVESYSMQSGTERVQLDACENERAQLQQAGIAFADSQFGERLATCFGRGRRENR